VADVADTRTPGTEQADTGQTDRPSSPFAGHIVGSSTRLVTGAAAITIVLGLLSFVLGMVVRNAPSAPSALHVIATVTGALSLIIGFYFQMISGTRNERIIIVTGMIAGFVGGVLGLAAGGIG
jgi:FtsH-binding integral membrane protein